MEGFAISELQKRLNISVSNSNDGFYIVDESKDKEFLELASRIIENSQNTTFSNKQVKRDGNLDLFVVY